MTVQKWAGLAVDSTETASANASGAKRIMIATLAYHRLRAPWRATDGRLNSGARCEWVQRDPQIFVESSNIGTSCWDLFTILCAPRA